MKILLYFDWVGTRMELTEHDAKMKTAANETGVTYMGIYGSMNQKWNYVYVFEATSFDHFFAMTQKVPRPVQMTHYISELLIPVALPTLI
ncbi:MAG: hypothetical protein NTV15_03870 [Candidatus Bathyarchaeota archaeon]|nr:hypothetical protein [Candidatus Bathyarchaeota archaeon]